MQVGWFLLPTWPDENSSAATAGTKPGSVASPSFAAHLFWASFNLWLVRKNSLHSSSTCLLALPLPLIVSLPLKLLHLEEICSKKQKQQLSALIIIIMITILMITSKQYSSFVCVCMCVCQVFHPSLTRLARLSTWPRRQSRQRRSGLSRVAQAAGRS